LRQLVPLRAALKTPWFMKKMMRMLDSRSHRRLARAISAPWRFAGTLPHFLRRNAGVSTRQSLLPARGARYVALGLSLLGACAHHQNRLDTGSFSTAPPPNDCSFVGRASGTGIEPLQAQALAHARENLGADADRLGGSYVQLTAQDTNKVEMQAVDAVQVRLEGRVYRCASDDVDAGARSLNANSATADGANSVFTEAANQGDAGAGTEPGGSLGIGGSLAGAGPRLACPASTEPRPLDPADGPGWQCARKLVEGWVAEGPYRLSWSSGATRSEGAFENGKRTGQWMFYFPNGQLRERATFRDGAMQGCADEFSADGATLPARCAGDSGAL
jgi:hypothetical protein